MGPDGVTEILLQLGPLVQLTCISTPARAELLTEPLTGLICLELTVTSVSRPTTAEGLTTNTLSLPLLVLIVTLALPTQFAPHAAPLQVTLHVPEFAQKPAITLQEPTAPPQSASDLQAVAPVQVSPAVQSAVTVHEPLDDTGPHATPPLIVPVLSLFNTHAVLAAEE